MGCVGFIFLDVGDIVFELGDMILFEVIFVLGFEVGVDFVGFLGIL